MQSGSHRSPGSVKNAGAAAASAEPQATKPRAPTQDRPGTPGASEDPGPRRPAPARVPRRPAPQRQAQPSWGTVLAATLRLWVQRRLAPAGRRVRLLAPGRRPTALLAAAVLVVAGALTVVLATTGVLGGKLGSTGPARAPASSAGAPGGGNGLADAAVAGNQAAQWVSRQVSADTVVSCDTAMCAVLRRHGVPAGRLMTLRPGQSDPLGPGIVVVTPAVRGQFGSRLSSVYAPVTLVVFGTGASRVAIKMTAPDGAAAYTSAFSADRRARKLAGRQLVTNARTRVSRRARRQLVAGRVDSRLLVTLATLAARHPVDIVRFGTPPGRRASPGLPLRSADIAPAAKRRGPQARMAALRRFYAARRPPYHPSSMVLVPARHRRNLLRVRYPVPEPLGLLGSRR